MDVADRRSKRVFCPRNKVPAFPLVLRVLRTMGERSSPGISPSEALLLLRCSSYCIETNRWDGDIALSGVGCPFAMRTLKKRWLITR